MTKMEELKLAVDSQQFYLQQCTEMDEEIEGYVKYIVETDFEDWSKDKMQDALEICHNSMILSGKFCKEAEAVLDTLSGLTREEYESDVETIAMIALTTRASMKKQKDIYEKLITLQGILIEILERF
jgi:hypothetical protein